MQSIQDDICYKDRWMVQIQTGIDIIAHTHEVYPCQQSMLTSPVANLLSSWVSTLKFCRRHYPPLSRGLGYDHRWQSLCLNTFL